MPRTQIRSLVACMFSAVTLFGCAATPKATWTNKGPVEIATERGRIACYTDANIIDGERMEGSLCASAASGFLSDGEPEVYFSPWNRRFLQVPISQATTGVTAPYENKTVFLQCTPLASTDSKVEAARDCKVTINNQLLVSAKITYPPK